MVILKVISYVFRGGGEDVVSEDEVAGVHVVLAVQISCHEGADLPGFQLYTCTITIVIQGNTVIIYTHL